MTVRTWVRKLFARPMRKLPARRRPTLEALEDRSERMDEQAENQSLVVIHPDAPKE